MTAGVAGSLVFGIAFAMRLPNLDAFVGKFDEGIRMLQLNLMARGYRPFRDVFASQGPLSLDVFLPAFLAFGEDLAAARATPVIASLVCLVAVGVGASTVAGWPGGLASMVTLMLSPGFLKYSRLALVEVPALAPAACAVACALHHHASGSRRSLYVGAVLLAVALMTKPMVAPVVVPIGILLLARGDSVVRSIATYGGVSLLTCVIAIGLYGPSDVYDQVVRFRLASRGAEPWSLRENWTALWGEWRDEGLAVFAAAVIGVVLAATRSWALGAALCGWIVATLVFLLAYSPLQFKHAVVMIPPIALAAGVGTGFMVRSLTKLTAQRSPALLADAGVMGAIVVWYLLSAPALVALDQRVIAGLPDRDPETYAEEIRLLSALTGRDDFVVVDEPWVAAAAHRLVPPPLVDTSMVRIRSRSLSGSGAVEVTERYDVAALMLFSDGLRSLRPFADWVDREFVPIKINERANGKDRVVYARAGANIRAARGLIESDVGSGAAATFGDQLRLIGHANEESVRAGRQLVSTTGWEAVGRPTADWHVLTFLLDGSGNVVEQNERSLGFGSGTRAWAPGQWAYRTSNLNIRANARPGEYAVAVALYDSRTRTVLRATGSTTDHHVIGRATLR
jgi:hypothetical protein